MPPRHIRPNPGESSQQSDDDTIALSSRTRQHTRQSSHRLEEDETLEQQTKRLALAKHEREMEILDIQKKTAELAAAAAASSQGAPGRSNAGLYEDSTETTPTARATARPTATRLGKRSAANSTPPAAPTGGASGNTSARSVEV